MLAEMPLAPDDAAPRSLRRCRDDAASFSRRVARDASPIATPMIMSWRAYFSSGDGCTRYAPLIYTMDGAANTFAYALTSLSRRRYMRRFTLFYVYGPPNLANRLARLAKRVRLLLPPRVCLFAR